MHPSFTGLSIETLHIVLYFMHTSVLITSTLSVPFAVVKRLHARRSQHSTKRLFANIVASTVSLFDLFHQLPVDFFILAPSQ
jgi:ABC-type arginine/histidine transport system permease subunit